MKVVICGSMKFSRSMIKAKDELEKLGHKVILPRHAEKYAKLNTSDHIYHKSAKNKINNDLIRDYYNEINESDAVLIINEKVNGIDNYVGGNSFLEMGFAHVLNKKLFLLNPIPQMIYTDELIAMQPIIIDGDIKNIN
jgi:predicted RNA-binding protein with PUA domain